MIKLHRTGERQIGYSHDQIRADHLARYAWLSKRVKKTDRIFDAGCGVGYGAQMLGQVGKSVLGMDCDANTIEFAKEHWSAPNVEFRVGNLHFLDLEENMQFDTIAAFEVAEHLVRPSLFLVELRRHMAPGARLYISSPNENVMPHTVDMNPYHIRHYTPETLKVLLENAGFRPLGLYSQNEEKLSEGGEGRTILIESTLAPINEVKANERKAVREVGRRAGQEALGDAEKELNLRANKIRGLQAVLHKSDRIDEAIIDRLAQVDDVKLKKELERVAEGISRQRSALFADMLEDRKENLAEAIARRVASSRNVQIDLDMAQLLGKFKDYRSELSELLNQRVEILGETLVARLEGSRKKELEGRSQLSDRFDQQNTILLKGFEVRLNRFIENTAKQEAASAATRERLTLLELREVEQELESELDAARNYKATAEKFEMQNHLLLSQINQANAALKTQTFEIVKRKSHVERLSNNLSDAKAVIVSLQGDIVALEVENTKFAKARAVELRLFDPDRPTVMGLVRVILRRGFFIKILVQAPYNSLMNVVGILRAKS